MKKFLSMVLTLALVLSLIPAVFAAGVTVEENGVVYNFVAKGTFNSVEAVIAHTDGWQYVDASNGGLTTLAKNVGLVTSAGKIRVFDGNWIAFKLRVPETINGEYDVSVTGTTSAPGGEYGQQSKVKVYLFPADDIESVEAGMKENLPMVSDAILGTSSTFELKLGIENFAADEYYMVFSFDIDPIQPKNKYIYLEKLTLTKTEELPVKKVSFAADNVKTLMVDGVVQEYTDRNLLSLDRGDKVTVVADEISGKTFRGWVRGSADYGRLVSNKKEYEFYAMTHTMLTAVYSEDTEAGGDVVEYYGWNEKYITTLPATADAPEAPEVTGYEFAEWVRGQSNDNIARAVAQYEADGETEYTVDVQDGVSVSVEGGKYIYDAKVTCTADKNVYWYRDNKLVDCGTEYSFYLWDNTDITTSVTAGHNGAKIMLDKAKGNQYMVEYDAGKADIVEVGIIFGNSADITIDTCAEKMNSQRSDFTHGQFSATADEYTVARGYLIYNDNSTYRVIYAN